MIASLIIIAVVLGIGYAFMMRGFFSSFLNMICAVIAGAIAFGLWEPISLMIIGAAPRTGFLSFTYDGAYAIGLALPFAASFAILRALTDKILGANIAVGTVANHVGGAACGVVAGIVTAGVMIISIGFTRSDAGLNVGFQRLDYGTQGNIKRGDGLLLPVDRIVAGFYGYMAEASLRTSTPLSRLYPTLDEVPAALRMTGSANVRNIMDPADLKLLGHYILDGGQGAKLATLLEDSWNPASQGVQDLTGQPFPQDSHVEGFVVNFGSGAKENFGQTVVGAPQVRLVMENENNERMGVFPIAVICQAQAADTAFGRFRFDGRDVFVGSVGGASEVRMGFDFVVPPGYTPIALYVKNARLMLDEETAPKPVKFTTTAARDAAVRSGQIIGIKAAGDLDTGDAKSVNTKPTAGTNGEIDGLQVGNNIGLTVQRGTQGNLEVSPDGPYIRDGEQIFDAKQFGKGGGLERNMRIDRFEITDDTAIVKVDVSAGKATSLLGKVAQSAESVVPPVLIDDKGQQFEAVGYVYEDKEKVQIRFTPGKPIRGMAELDQAKVGLSRSRTDQKMTLVFRVSVGSKIKAFAFGSKVVTDFNPPIAIEKQK